MKDVGGKALWTLEKIIGQTSMVPDTPYFDSNLFEWTKDLEANHAFIKREVETILNNLDRVPEFQQISEDQKSITQDDKWKTYFLYGFGYKAEAKVPAIPRGLFLLILNDGNAVPG